MLNIRGIKVYTQDELMDNLVIGIKTQTDEKDWQEHIDTASNYIADTIGESTHYVRGYLRKALRLER